MKVRVGRPERGGSAVIVLALLPLKISGSTTCTSVSRSSTYHLELVARGLDIGAFSIAIGAFMGIGAYTAAIPSVWLHWSPWVTIPLGAVAATILGAALAFPFARLRTIYYAMGTLFLGYVVINLITAGGKTTGMSTGLGGVEPLFSDRAHYYYLTLGLTIISMICMHRFEFIRGCPG